MASVRTPESATTVTHGWTRPQGATIPTTTSRRHLSATHGSAAPHHPASAATETLSTASPEGAVRPSRLQPTQVGETLSLSVVQHAIHSVAEGLAVLEEARTARAPLLPRFGPRHLAGAYLRADLHHLTHPFYAPRGNLLSERPEGVHLLVGQLESFVHAQELLDAGRPAVPHTAHRCVFFLRGRPGQRKDRETEAQRSRNHDVGHGHILYVNVFS